MRKRIGIYCATEEARQLIPSLLENPEFEVGAVVDRDADSIREQLGATDPALARVLDEKLTPDLDALLRDTHLHAVIDASPRGRFAADHPDLAARGVQVVTPLTARLLWCFRRASRHSKSELLTALHEIVESYNLTVDADDLFSRVLEIAVAVTGAEGGSLMLLDHASRELRVRVAAGVEPELWPKIRVPLGHGIAGRVAADGRPLRLRGKADRQAFGNALGVQIDGEAALLVNLSVTGAQVLSCSALKPTKTVKMLLPSSDAPVLCRGRIVWARLEPTMPGRPIRYRAGMFFTASDQAAVQTFMTRHGAHVGR